MARKDESAATPPDKAAQPDLPLDAQPDPALEKVPDSDWYKGEADPDAALGKVPDPDWYAGEMEPLPEDDGSPLTSGDFHNIAQKQILNAVFAILSDTKMSWETVQPFLAAARDVLLGDIEETAQLRLHTVQQDDKGGWVEAEEAYLGLSVSDRDEGGEWLSETWWLSEVAIAEEDPEQVRAIVRGLEKTIAKLNLWLADRGGPVPPAPSAS
jgi:hypothetical protein